MKITIGVTTYNRKNILQMMAKSFYESHRPYSYSLRIYDDCSEFLSEEEIRDIFPDAVSIYRQPFNRGADFNTFYMYEDFLKTDDDIFFNADSDLIFSLDWMEKGLCLLENTEGILSIFNAENHPAINNCNGLLKKSDIGAAGTFFLRDKLNDFMSYLYPYDSIKTDGVDWTFSKYFQSHGINMYASEISYVQHIGLFGYNSRLEYFDFGKNFEVDSITNGQILNDIIEFHFGKRSPQRQSYYLFPFEDLNRGERVILYGYGNVGRDFEKQIRESGYCRLEGIVDKNFKNMPNVKSPAELVNLNFDKIILAVADENMALSMKQNINDIDKSLSYKIFYKRLNVVSL